MKSERANDRPGIQERTFHLAIRLVKLCRHLEEKPGVGRTLSWQLLRAGTSIGANVEEAQAGQSRADFISKNAIALKEARETAYWLRLLAAAQIVPQKRISELQSEVAEVKRILGAIVVTAKRNAR
ncbi:MAG: four helix bundle protein [Terriglobales bacterium]